jgi:cold-inducible RNA-binding protein
MRLRVQDIPTSINADELQALFEPFGEVLWVEIAYDEISRRPLGHAFIEIRSEADALAAIHAVNGRQMGDHTLTVTPADGGSQVDSGHKSDAQTRRYDSRRRGGRRGGKFQGGWGF